MTLSVLQDPADMNDEDLTVRWYSNEFDATAVVGEQLREAFGAREVEVGRLCGQCGSSGHGRPWARVDQQTVHVSWSRAMGRLVTAVSRRYPVGVDVESVSSVGMAWPVDGALATGEAPATVLDFARLWVAKEAIVKAQGVGLMRPMDQVRLADFEGRVHELPAPDDLVAAVALLR